jgi:hypothetical protein
MQLCRHPRRGLARKPVVASAGILRVERMRQLDYPSYDSGRSNQAGGRLVIARAGALQHAQASQVEEAKLAQVDNTWGSVLAGALEFFGEQRRGVQVELADQPQPNAPRLILAAYHDEWWCVLVRSHSRLPIA